MDNETRDEEGLMADATATAKPPTKDEERAPRCRAGSSGMSKRRRRERRAYKRHVMGGGKPMGLKRFLATVSL